MLRYARDRIGEFLLEVDQVGQSEFPYASSKGALEDLRDHFQQVLRGLNDLQDGVSSPETIKDACANALGDLHEYVPLLGFILRSTNVRNAFELYAPLQRLCELVLEPAESPLTRKTHLILSSEWYYEAQVHPAKTYLANYVLIGLPAPESSNPLLLPLAGHEIGHPLWHVHGLRDHFFQVAASRIIEKVLSDKTAFKDAYPSEPDPEQITSTYLVQHVNRLFSNGVHWLVSQAEETFCDFVGMRLFGYAYMNAFAYMVAPRLSMERVEQYPKLTTRVDNLLNAADRLHVEVPSSYADLFEDDEDPDYHDSAKYNLMLADNSLGEMVAELCNKVGELLPDDRIPLPSDAEAERILGRLKYVIPAENALSLADIVNAAWRAFEDPGLWEGMPEVLKKRDRALKESILKSIELFEIEHRGGRSDQCSESAKSPSA